MWQKLRIGIKAKGKYKVTRILFKGNTNARVKKLGIFN